MAMKIRIADTGRFFEAQVMMVDPAAAFPTGTTPGSVYRMQIIAEGLSLNGRYYPRDVLRKSIPLFEGSRVFAYQIKPSFWDHLPAPLIGKNFAKDLVGWLEHVALVETDDGVSALWGDLHVIDPALRAKFMEAAAAGKLDMFGFSIDADGSFQKKKLAERLVDWVESIDQVQSVDLVTLPAAGGKLMRLVAAVIRESEGTMDPRLIAFLQAHPDLIGRESLAGMKTEEIESLLQETLKKAGGTSEDSKAAEAVIAAKAKEAADKVEAEKLLAEESARKRTAEAEAAKATEALKAKEAADAVAKKASEEALKTTDGKAAEALKQAGEALTEARKIRCEAALDTALASETKLPVPLRDLIRTQFAGRVFESAELTTAIKAQKDTWARLVESKQAVDVPDTTQVAHGMIHESERLQAMLDMTMGFKPDPAAETYKGIKGLRSLREAYKEFTGDAQVRGVNHRVRRLMESGRIIEAKTSDFAIALGTSMTRRVVQAYTETNHRALWDPMVSIEELDNFKTQTRVRFGEFGFLSSVTEDNDYTAITKFSEEEATYIPGKKGNTFSVTREMILNDDLKMLRDFATMLGRAGQRTLARFVFDLIIGYGGTTPAINNAVIYDAKALYHNDHTNIGTTALGYDALSAGELAIFNQKDMDSIEEIGLSPKFLVIPKALEGTADVLLGSPNKPGDNHNDVNVHYKTLTKVVSPFLRGDLTNWYLVCDPKDCQTVEIGFVQGVQEPEILVQDKGDTGDVFKADKVTYKIRHEYGGAVIDYRAFYGAIVA